MKEYREGKHEKEVKEGNRTLINVVTRNKGSKYLLYNGLASYSIDRNNRNVKSGKQIRESNIIGHET